MYIIPSLLPLPDWVAVKMFLKTLKKKSFENRNVGLTGSQHGQLKPLAGSGRSASDADTATCLENWKDNVEVVLLPLFFWYY